MTHSTVDGSLTLVTSDYGLDGEAWEIKLFKKSTYSVDSQSEGVYQFTVTFRDICWDSNLQAAQFLQAAYTYDLYAE